MNRVLSLTAGSVAILTAMLVGTGTAAATPDRVPSSASAALTGGSGSGADGTDCGSTDMTGTSGSSECPGPSNLSNLFGTGSGSAAGSSVQTGSSTAGSGTASTTTGTATGGAGTGTAAAIMAAIEDFIKALFAALGLGAPAS